VAISRRFSRTPESDKPPLDARSGDRRQSHSQRLLLRSHDARRRLLPPLRSSAFSQCLPLSVAASRMSSLSNRSRAGTSNLRPHRPLRRPSRSLFSAVVRQGRRAARRSASPAAARVGHAPHLISSGLRRHTPGSDSVDRRRRTMRGPPPRASWSSCAGSGGCRRRQTARPHRSDRGRLRESPH